MLHIYKGIIRSLYVIMRYHRSIIARLHKSSWFFDTRTSTNVYIEVPWIHLPNFSRFFILHFKFLDRWAIGCIWKLRLEQWINWTIVASFVLMFRKSSFGWLLHVPSSHAHTILTLEARARCAPCNEGTRPTMVSCSNLLYNFGHQHWSVNWLGNTLTLYLNTSIVLLSPSFLFIALLDPPTRHKTSSKWTSSKLQLDVCDFLHINMDQILHYNWVSLLLFSMMLISSSPCHRSILAFDTYRIIAMHLFDGKNAMEASSSN
jgi:hypothetical protein